MLSYAVCTYNRADRLPDVIRSMRRQHCTMPFEILVINNNSQDDTLEVLEQLSNEEGPSLRVVTETAQGIVHARNRAIQEALNSDILVFIDDDERPLPGHLQAVVDCIARHGADCVGGRIGVGYAPYRRPAWLNDEMEGFLGAIDYGPEPFEINTDKTPVWSGNVAYRMQYFRDHPDIRFDQRYNRAGVGIGGGSDNVMFNNLLRNGARLYYRPDMAIEHEVDPWKLKKRYFLTLHYKAGVRRGRFEVDEFPTRGLPAPPFMIIQFLRQALKAIGYRFSRPDDALRQAMTAANAWGAVVGYTRRNKPL